MSAELAGKVVLVTGGARRIGAAICRVLHGRGASVMLHHRGSASEARALQSELNALRADSVALIKADLLNGASLPDLVKMTVRQFGGLDLLVNNASSFFPTEIGTITDKNWDDLIGTNLKAPMFLAQAAAPELRKRRGCIINIVDIHAEFPMKNYLVYTVAKGGLLALTRSLARELAPEVRVNGVAPGAIVWPEDEAWSNELSRQRIINRIPLKQVGAPDDIAQAVAYLAAAPYVTGQVISVDGGLSIAL